MTATPPRPSQRPATQEPETIRQMLLNDPHQLSLLRERNPRLAEIINNPEEFTKVSESWGIHRGTIATLWYLF